MIDAKTNEVLKNEDGTKTKYRLAKKALMAHEAIQTWINILDHRLVGPKEVEDKIIKDIDGKNLTAEIEFRALPRPPSMSSKAPDPVEAIPLYPYAFVVDSVSNMEADPKKFKVVDPGNAQVTRLATKSVSKSIPHKESHKPIGYVVNLASYYGEKGVRTIAPNYYQNAISGSAEEKGNRLALVAGLNSFEPAFPAAYEKTRKGLYDAVDSFQMPGIAANVTAFSFFWQPQWHYNGQPISLSKLRWGLSHYPDDSQIARDFSKRQDDFKEKLPYGIFRETVTASHETKNFTEKLSHFNDPVYIHSGDGDSTSLKVPADLSGTPGKGILDRFTEALGPREHKPMLAIGGYNFFHIDPETVKTEIVKADPAITEYRENVEGKKAIDKQKKIALDKLKPEDALFVDTKCKQIIHNTQVVNRWDHLIRTAINRVFPKMLYPTEPNMLIKAHDEKKNFDLFKHDQFKGNGTLKDDQRGSLWGNTASEGRRLRENLESMYSNQSTATGKGFVEWIDQASLPTDTRGFARHFLVSGYERYPDSIDPKEWPPVYHPPTTEKRNQPIPLKTAAIQQAQSYTSAFRLTEMYCLGKGIKTDSDEGIAAKKAFSEIETIAQRLMNGQSATVSMTQGPHLYGEIVFQIKRDFLTRFGKD